MNQVNSQHVSSCITGTFEPLSQDHSKKNNWSFCYNENQNAVNFTVNINAASQSTDKDHQHLNAETKLSPDDIDLLINWLYQVKVTMQAKKSKSTDSA